MFVNAIRLLFFSIPLLNGCATHLYDGMKKSPRELSLIRESDAEVSILEIDDKQVPKLQQDFYVLPGKHHVKARLKYQSHTGGIVYNTIRSKVIHDVCFDSEKNKKYIVRAKLHKEREWVLKVEEFRSDKSLNISCE